jgi:signal transduction histidine kinase
MLPDILQLDTANTDLKNKVAELNEIVEKLKTSNQLKDRLLNILSHDVYSPLRFSTMVGKALLIKKEELNKEEIIDALTDINQAGTRMLLLISNILKWVEYQKENYSSQLTKENLYQIVQDKMEFFRFMASSKNIELINKIEKDIFFTTDKTAVGVIIQNLINNAVKFTPDGEIEITAALNTKYITVTISDTGVGMPKENIEAIKSRQPAEPMPDNENLKGNGLGWVLINELLQHLQGTFEIKSGEGIGTTVKIILPLSFQ